MSSGMAGKVERQAKIERYGALDNLVEFASVALDSLTSNWHTNWGQVILSVTDGIR
jgi:hypothetical protein